MKASKVAFAMLFLFVTVFSSSAYAHEFDTEVPIQNHLPRRLLVIGEEAFDGTGFPEICLSSRVRRIGEGAFANMARLRYIYIPKSVESIAEDAFRNTRNLAIIGSIKSYAQEWARKKCVRFIPIDAWVAILSDQYKIGRHRAGRSDRLDETARSGNTTSERELVCVFTTNPKDRPEMYPIDYDFP